MSFEHGVVELVRAPNFTVARYAKTVMCGFEPAYRKTHISYLHCLQLVVQSEKNAGAHSRVLAAPTFSASLTPHFLL